MRYSLDMDGHAWGFVHKKIIGAVVKRAGRGQRRAARRRRRAAAAARQPVMVPTAPPVRRPAPRTETARPSETSAAEKERGRQLKIGNGGNGVRQAAGCTFPARRAPDGSCRIFLGDRPGRDDIPVGEAVLGQFGAGLEPGSRMVDRAVCIPGMVLGKDGVCYNRSQIRNSDRMWPKGRKPLLTGGEMRCITIAATAGRRLERATKRLQKIGLMKKPPPRRKLISGPAEHHHHT